MVDFGFLASAAGERGGGDNPPPSTPPPNSAARLRSAEAECVWMESGDEAAAAGRAELECAAMGLAGLLCFDDFFLCLLLTDSNGFSAVACKGDRASCPLYMARATSSDGAGNSNEAGAGAYELLLCPLLSRSVELSPMWMSFSEPAIFGPRLPLGWWRGWGLMISAGGATEEGRGRRRRREREGTAHQHNNTTNDSGEVRKRKEPQSHSRVSPLLPSREFPHVFD